MKRRILPYNFSPTAHLKEPDLSRLVGTLSLQGVSSVFPLHAWRRRGAWATTLPLGVFINDFRPDVTTQLAHDAARGAIYASYRAVALAHDVSPRPHDPSYGAVVVDGQTFYHVEAIRFLRSQVADPAFLTALYFFLLDAAKTPALIAPPRPRAPYVPHAQRKQVHNLTHAATCRGPGWTPEEDAVLRRWFGMHTYGEHAGRHANISPAGWQRVLDVELGGRRTQASVQARFVQLNNQLLQAFAVDGYVPITQVAAYMQQAVGIRPRLPPIRPRRAPRAPIMREAP